MIKDLLTLLNKDSDKNYFVHTEYMPHSSGGWDRNRPAAYMLYANNAPCSNYMGEEEMISLLALLWWTN